MSKINQVFVSYDQEDSEIAHLLATDLKNHGAEVWIAPDTIKPGEGWVAAINRGFSESTHFAVVLTPAAMASEWVRKEVNSAIALERKGRMEIIPLDVKACDLPPLWSSYQMIDFCTDYGTGLNKLKSLLDLPGDKPAPLGITTDTPLGKTMVSNVADQDESTSTVNTHTTFTHPDYRFQIRWPLGGKWSRSDDFEQPAVIVFVIKYHQSFSDFTPNVNITIEQVGSINIQQWMEMGNTTMSGFGYKIEEAKFDDATQAGVRVFRNPNVAGVLYQVQRAIIRRGFAYVATTSKLEADYAVFPQLYDEMSQILNSFRVLD